MVIMSSRVDITGKRFGSLVVLSYNRYRNNKSYWNVECDCGRFTTARSDKLRSKRTKSCGCHNEPLEMPNLDNPEKDLKIKRYEKVLYAIISLSLEQDNEEVVNIIINAIRGHELSDEYEGDALEGIDFMGQFDE
jgi:hypothetical protein